MKKNLKYQILWLFLLTIVWQGHAQSFGIEGYSNGESFVRCREDRRVFTATAGVFTDYRWYVNTPSSTPIGTGRHLEAKTIDDLTCSAGGACFATVYVTADSLGYQVISSLSFTSIAEMQKPDLGNDIVLCEGEDVTLSSSVKYGSGITYAWNVNPLFNNKPELDVNTPGTYILRVQNTFKCTASDTVIVDVIENRLDLPVSVSMCDGNDALIASQTPLAASDKIVWSNGANSRSIKVNTAGKYKATVTSSLNGKSCTFEDSTEAMLRDRPEVNLGIDTLLCHGSSIELKNLSNKPVNNTSFHSWNTGASTPTLSVNNSGLFTLTITSSYGCQDSDEVEVTVFNPTFNLGPDTSICDNKRYDLTPRAVQFNSDAVFYWNTVAGTQNYRVENSETISLEIRHPLLPGCNFQDDISISVLKGPSPDLGEDLSVEASTLVDGSNGTNIDVNNDSFSWYLKGSNKVLGTDTEIELGKSGVYVLMIESAVNGCKGYDTINFEIQPPLLPKTIFAPSAFSKSASDEENRVFKVMGSAIDASDFLVTIFDRWGNIVFSSDNFSKMSTTGWDGISNGSEIIEGTYAYTIKGKYLSGEDIKISGSVTYMP